MNVISFVRRLDAIKGDALAYISDTIKTKGEIHIQPDENDEYSDLVVPFTDSFTGRMSNLYVHTIKEDSLVGYEEYDEEAEITTDEWNDGVECYVADYVAGHYGELK